MLIAEFRTSNNSASRSHQSLVRPHSHSAIQHLAFCNFSCPPPPLAPSPARESAASARSPALDAVFAAAMSAACEPLWLEQTRRDAWARLNRDGDIAQGITVDKKDERWRFSAHKGWNLDGARPAPRPNTPAACPIFFPAPARRPSPGN